MDSSVRLKTKIAGIFSGLVLLALVGYGDYITGYKILFFIFYLLPILVVLRFAGKGAAFAMASLSTFVWFFSNMAAGATYSDLFTPIWNSCIMLSFFILVVVLFSSRDLLKQLVDQRTEKLRQEIHERSRLQDELLGIAEAEQRKIGHDLHDGLGQHLTATALACKVLAKKLANKSPVEPAAAQRLVVMVEDAIELTRNHARTLHPIDLAAGGLVDALQNLAANVSKAFNVSCRLQHSGAVVLNDPNAALHLYRIAQEAVSNAIRHGRARNIVISLDATSKSTMLTVTDDGAGLSPDARVKKGMGLRIMNYRAAMINATFDIQNLPSGGARAVCVYNPNLKGAVNYGAEN